jgi:tRNA dimethylallyltransferase
MTVEKKPLVVLLGPTAVGKTEIAIKIAEHLNGEIVSADSRLFYRGMDIGTAKPSTEDQMQVKHFLIDVAAPDDCWSLARYQKEAFKAINNIHSRNKLPFLVGGTGQYIRAVIEGWDIPLVKPNPELRRALEKLAHEIGKHKLHEHLMKLDPDAGKKINYTNLRRTIRALEVIFSTGKRFSEQKSRSPTPYQTLIIGLELPRNELYARVDARIENMIENGFVEEVKRLLDEGYSPSLPTFSAIGYREIISYLENKITLTEAVAEMKRKTRIFIRRQANWFKKDDPEINWFQMNYETSEKIIGVIFNWLELMKTDQASSSSKNTKNI